MSRRCIYFVEGESDEKLISALKVEPPLLIPGKIKVYNVIQELIPLSVLLTIKKGTLIVLAFDTDKKITSHLIQNIDRIKKYCIDTKIVFLHQVLKLEDELVRSTDVKKVKELTHSRSDKNFKSDFCAMQDEACRSMLERHHLDIEKLWISKASADFEKIIIHNSHIIKNKK